LTREFKDRLVRHLNFLEEEIKDYTQFKKLTREEYLTDRDKRRNVERWFENIINSTVDIVRVILTMEEMVIPDTYRRIVEMISAVEGFGQLAAEQLSKWVRLRNIVTHEYLDIKWSSISKFIDETDLLYKNFIKITRHYLKNKIESGESEQQEESRQ
jgi:uncharacterized protein YutE (UPF0331/DUF86 family)